MKSVNSDVPVAIPAVIDTAHRAGVIPYEERLARYPEWALNDASLYFEDKGSVRVALRKITAKLRELDIDYAVVGALALFHHGVRRFTEDVDLLVTRDGLRKIHEKLEGLGYVPPFTGSKHLRDTENGVKIEFLVAGDFPGDGKPKPIAFPDPKSAAVESEGIKYINLATFIEMKIASGMTSPQRPQDLTDAQTLISVMNLPAEFVERLNPYIRDKFTELWKAARPVVKRYVLIARKKASPTAANKLDDRPPPLEIETAALQAMLADGVVIDSTKNPGDGLLYLVTDDSTIAAKYDMHAESEFIE